MERKINQQFSGRREKSELLFVDLSNIMLNLVLHIHKRKEKHF